MPGGAVYVTRGILAMMNSEAELAAVLGHEIGHVNARHSMSQMSKQQVATLGLAVGSVIRGHGLSSPFGAPWRRRPGRPRGV